MSITPPDAAPLLGAEHLNGVLDACSYRGVAVQLSGARSLAPGCTVLLQFGDQVTAPAEGGLCLTIRCGLQINGAAEHTIGATYWRVQMPPFRLAGLDEGLSVALDADLILAKNVTIADALARGRDVYRHLRLLIADARDTLGELRLDESGRADAAAGPALRIEARLLGDLISGRSGVVAGNGSRSRISVRYRRITNAACGWLLDEALPNLARAVAAVIPQARVARRARSARSLQDPSAAAGGGLNDPPIVPGLELVR